LKGSRCCPGASPEAPDQKKNIGEKTLRDIDSSFAKGLSVLPSFPSAGARWNDFAFAGFRT